MSKIVKSGIHQLVDCIEDEKILQIIMEDVAYYANDKDAVAELTKDQLKELDEVIADMDKKETTTWIDFRIEINEWKKR